MDISWAQARLEEYLGLCNEITVHQKASGGDWDDRCAELNDEAELRLPTVEGIVREAYPLAPQPLMPPKYASQDSEHWVRRALGAIQDSEENAIHLHPESPLMRADRLHDRVWSAAAPTWDTGEYGSALQQASIALSAYIRTKAHSRLRDRPLVREVFSPREPGKGGTRLHLKGDPADVTWQARQDGLHLIAQGAFAGIRNIAAHEENSWTEQEAIELLAVLSVIARWTDETQLVVGPPTSTT